jgi:hypothetical protein
MQNRKRDCAENLLIILNLAGLAASVYAKYANPDNKDNPEVNFDILTHLYQTIYFLVGRKIPDTTIPSVIAASLNLTRCGQILFRAQSDTSIFPTVANIIDFSVHTGNICKL